MKRLYFDWNASAPMRPEVADLVHRVGALPGNPSSVHAEGRALRGILEESRLRFCKALDAGNARVVWTSGATEANNLAILGFARSIERRGLPRKLKISAVEHPSILAPAARLAASGWIVEKLPVDSGGFVNPDALARATEDASLVSILLANNEVGTVQRIESIRRSAGCVVHSDSAQALGRIPYSFQQLGVDAATFSGHKFGGPRGTGALLLRRDAAPDPILLGGEQELGLRAGTESVAAVAGLVLAAELAVAEQKAAFVHFTVLRELLEKRLRAALPDLRFLTAPTHSLPNTVALLIPGVDSHALLVALDLEGVAVSMGSACASGSLQRSHVLTSMGLSADESRSVVRVSLGLPHCEGDICEFVERFARVAARLPRQ